MKKEFKIGIFNVRGLVDEHKQNLLNQDLNNYHLDVYCLQKTKINQDLDINPTYCCKSYRCEFIASKYWRSSIHKVWEVFKPKSVLQLIPKDSEYRSGQMIYQQQCFYSAFSSGLTTTKNQQNEKRILIDARSYASTSVNSDHRLVIALLDVANYIIQEAWKELPQKR